MLKSQTGRPQVSKMLKYSESPLSQLPYLELFQRGGGDQSGRFLGGPVWRHFFRGGPVKKIKSLELNTLRITGQVSGIFPYEYWSGFRNCSLNKLVVTLTNAIISCRSLSSQNIDVHHLHLRRDPVSRFKLLHFLRLTQFDLV